MVKHQTGNSDISVKIPSVVAARLFGTTPTEAICPKSRRKERDMAVNGSGIRDTARVLSVSPTTVIEELKKSSISS